MPEIALLRNENYDWFVARSPQAFASEVWSEVSFTIFAKWDSKLFHTLDDLLYWDLKEAP